ncbi:metallophosphoesterase, partial [Streptomyces cinereoruber]
MVVFLLVLVVVLALLGGVHWYVWRRLVRDVTAPGGLPRRIGTAAVVVLPLLSLGALVSARAGVPFPVQQVIAWPGQMWLAVLLYLVLALVVGEAVRPLLRAWLARRAPAAAAAPAPAPAVPEAVPVPAAATEPLAETAPAAPDAATATPVGPETPTDVSRR